MKWFRSDRARFLLVTGSMLGLCLLAGCNSSGSSGGDGIGGKIPSRTKKLQEAKEKVVAGKK